MSEATNRVEVWIGKATMNEKPQVDALAKRCGKHVRSYFGIFDLDSYFEKGHVILAGVSGSYEPKAFAVIRPLVRKPSVTLYELGTDPDSRGLGLATSILSWIQLSFPDKAVTLVVNHDNVEGQNLYIKTGFKVVTLDTTKSGKAIVRMELPPLTTRSN